MEKILPLRQGRDPDCSLAACFNCARLNNPEFEKKFTQELLNKYMPDYINKHPRDAFYYLKDKGYALRFIPLSFAGAKNILKKGRAVICQMKYSYDWWINLQEDMVENWRDNTHPSPAKKHFFCLKMEGEKMFIYDSNFPIKYEITDWERFHKAGILSDNYYLVR